MIIATNSAKHLITALSKKTQQKVLSYKTFFYPNGEYYYRLLFTKKPKSISLVGNITAEPKSIFELLALAQAARDSSILISHAIIPYLGYSRHDKIIQSGEAKLAQTIGNVLKIIPAKRFIFVDIHSPITNHFLPLHTEISFLPQMKQSIKEKFDIFVAPDFGAEKRARLVADKQPFIVMPKQRKGAHDIRRKQSVYGVKGKNILIVDDIIDTGATIITAAKMLAKQGARSISAMATHGVFSVRPETIQKRAHLKNIWVSNTIPQTGAKRISIIEAIAQAISLD